VSPHGAAPSARATAPDTFPDTAFAMTTEPLEPDVPPVPTDLAAFRRLSVPLCQGHRLFNKVFGIGANKTGTSTLQAVFSILGLDVAPQQPGELAGLAAYRGRFEPLVDYIRRHDAFQDAPFSIKSTYAQVDALFPGSRFILTHRPAEEWFESLLQFHRKIFGCRPDQARPQPEQVQRFHYLFEGYLAVMAEANWLLDVRGPDLSLSRDWSLNYDPAHYMARYEQRNAEIVRHFSERPDDLLVIDLTRETDTTRIVDFLGLPRALVTAMPHLNKT